MVGPKRFELTFYINKKTRVFIHGSMMNVYACSLLSFDKLV